MPVARSRWLVMLAFTVLCGLAFASSASAALTQTPFGCRASVTRVMVGSSTLAEPYVANPRETPCYTDSSGVGAAKIPTPGSTAIQAGPVGAFTYSVFDRSGATAPGAAAVVSVQGVTIPTPSATIYIAGPTQATVNYACVNDQLVSSASSTLNLIYINGKATPIPAGQQTVIPLGGGAYVAVNLKTVTATSLTEQIARVHVPGLTDIVVGEAQVTQSKADPCAGTTGVPPVLEICPPGSTLDVVHQFCVIIVPGGRTIIVSRPFRGPSGGTVLALSVARKRYHSPCLYGPGPKYALVATKRGGRVFGTLYSDRILALGDFERVAGFGGNDCIDGKGTAERLFDGNGKDRIYASHGSNRIGAGNGNDRIYGGRDHDWITAGNGNDTVYGNGGNDRIDVGLGRNHVFGGPGANRIFAGGGNSVVNCGPGARNTAFLRGRAIRFAAAHGCTQIIHLK